MSSVTRKIISTADAPGAIGPYSQAVQVDKTLYISGSLGLLPDKGVLVEGGVKAETHQSITGVWAILKAAGGSLNNGRSGVGPPVGFQWSPPPSCWPTSTTLRT